jgi:hypothetical protein
VIAAAALGPSTAFADPPPVPASAPPPAPPAAGAGAVDARTDRVDDIFRKGMDAIKAGKNEEARAFFREAWSLRKTYDIAANYAVVEEDKKNYPLACELYDYALRHAPPTAEQKMVAVKLAEMKRHVGTVRLTVNLPGATIVVDGKPVAETPIDADLFIPPGQHTLEVSRDDCDTFSRSIEAKEGSVDDVSILLVKTVSTPLVTAGLVTGTIAAVVGVVLLVESGSKGTQADNLLATLQQSPTLCPAQGSQCSQLEGLRSDHDTFHNIGLPLLIGGGAVAVGTVAYALWPRGKGKRATTTTGWVPAPVVTEKGGGLWLKGAF